jgi:uncharacterized membrane protein
MAAPVFVKIDRYREVEDTLTQIYNKTQEARSLLEKLEHVRTEEEHELSGWREEIASMEHKLASIKSKLRHA